MLNILRSELYRLRKRPQTWMMPGLAAAFILLYYGIGFAEYQTLTEAERIDIRQSVQQLSGIFENGMQIWRVVALVMIVVVGSSLIGSEHSWNTLRPLVARSKSRSDLLAAKWITVALFTVLMVITGVLVSLIAASITTGFMGGTISLPVVVWDDMLLGTLRWMIASMPYGVIAFTAALITRSNAAGIAIGIGLNFAELIVLGILLELVEGYDSVVEYGINWNVQQLVNITTEDGGSMLDPVSTGQVWQSAGIIALYCVFCIGLTFFVFTRRDITSG